MDQQPRRREKKKLGSIDKGKWLEAKVLKESTKGYVKNINVPKSQSTKICMEKIPIE